MKLETFFNKFDELADTPNAVPRMRRFVLDLALRGKLVAKDASDESAHELLKRVQTEKARLVKSGEIKRQGQLPPVSEDAIPFKLPSGWATSQLGDVAVCLDYMREPINGTERDLRIAGKAQSALFPYYGATRQQGWIDDFIFDAELVLLGEDGIPFFDDLRPKAYLISGKTWVNNHAHVFQGILVSNPFLMHWLNTFDYTGRVAGSTRSKLNQAKAMDIPVALPPLAEQKRIVAKVDELMALCDRLGAQQQELETRHAALARASLARFADAPTPANLRFLFHPFYAIPPADLRGSILSLAVQGKLVPQDPRDGPAERSWPELASAAVESDADGVPAHWLRVPLGECGEWRGGGTPSKSRAEFWEGTIPWVSPKDMKALHISDAQDHISEAAVEGSSVRKIPPGSLLMVVRGMILARAFPVALTTGDVTINQDMKALLPFERDMRDYLLLALRAFEPEVLATVERSSHGTCKLKTEFLHGLTMPIPPLAEQRRIVARVDQLMALVDELEEQLDASRTIGADLIEAVAAGLTAKS